MSLQQLLHQFFPLPLPFWILLGILSGYCSEEILRR